MIPAVGKSGAGTNLIRSSTVVSGFFSSAWQASTTSPKLCGGILVAMPTAIPEEPLMSRFGTLVGSAAGSCSLDRKSTRLNSSHLVISYAVFCLKKKKKQHTLYVLRDTQERILAST